MRARESDTDGFVEHLGVKIHYEVYGDDRPTILLMPTWTIVHKRFWKAQLAYLARHHRLVTYDGPGNGRSDRPLDPNSYDQSAQVAYALAVLDATGTDRAVLVSLSRAGNWALQLAAEHADRVLGTVLIGAGVALAPTRTQRPAGQAADVGLPAMEPSRVPRLGADPDEHWAKLHPSYWREHYDDFLWFFFGQCFSEPHSSKPIEDAVGWGRETTAAVLAADRIPARPDRETIEAWSRNVSGPVLLIHGSDDRVVPLRVSEALSELTGGELVVLDGAGHMPMARDPIQVNLLIHAFAERVRPPARGRRTWRR